MEKQTNDKAYTRAYNDGYLIGLFEQEVAEYMMESMQVDNDYLFGFKAGLDQGDKERIEQSRIDELQTSRESTDQTQEQSPDLGLDL